MIPYSLILRTYDEEVHTNDFSYKRITHKYLFILIYCEGMRKICVFTKECRDLRNNKNLFILHFAKGSKSVIKMPSIAMTTMSSIKVNLFIFSPI